MNTYPEKEKIAVVNRYLNGEKIPQISQSTKISRTTIYLWIKERNNSFNKGKAPDFRYLHDLQEKCDRQQKIIEILQRSPCTPSAPLSKRYEVIKSLSDEYTVNILCEALKVAKGSYYNHILRNKNGNTKAANRKAEMLPVIDQIFHDYNEILCDFERPRVRHIRIHRCKDYARKRNVFYSCLRENALQTASGTKSKYIATTISGFTPE